MVAGLEVAVPVPGSSAVVGSTEVDDPVPELPVAPELFVELPVVPLALSLSVLVSPLSLALVVEFETGPQARSKSAPARTRGSR